MSFYLGIQKTKNKTSWEKINTLCTCMHWSPTCHDPSYTKPRPSLMYTSSNRNMANKMNFLSYANSTTWAFWSKCPSRKKRKGLLSVAWYLAKSTNLFIALVLACLLCDSHRQSCVGWGQEKGETRWLHV